MPPFAKKASASGPRFSSSAGFASIGLSSLGADMPVEAPLWQFPMLLAHVSRDARTLSGGAMAARGRMLPSGVNASAIYRPWDIDLWRLVGSGSGDGYRENGCATGAGSTRHARRNGDAGDEDPRLLNGDSSWGARRGTVHGKTKRRTSILPQSLSNAPAPPRISRAVGSPRGVALMRPTMRRRGKMSTNENV